MSAVNLSRVGSHFYEEHFGYKYIDINSMSSASDDNWVLMPDKYCSVAPIQLGSKHVAVVGNGRVFGRGSEIDSRDAVVRINYPYQWRRVEKDDGLRFTHWCGLGKNEVFYPELFHMPPKDMKFPSLDSFFMSVDSLYCISHHHVQKKFLDAVFRLGLIDKLVVNYSSPIIFDVIDRSFLGKDRFIQSWITDRVYIENGYGGWFGWDLLFTGVKTVIMCALSMPKSISVYGMDFYASASNAPWDMHNIDLNREVLFKVGHLCRASGIEFEIFDSLS